MIVTRRLVLCDPDVCLGCQICEFVCSATKEKSLDSSLSRIHVVNFENLGNVAMACMLCEKPPCVTACPRRALHQNEEGVIQVDETKCNGCGWCIMVCKFGAITLHLKRRVVTVCDLCDGEPECVKACPFEGALTYATLEEVAHKFRRNTVMYILQELAGKSKRSV